MKSLLLVMTACIVLGATGCKNQLSEADINGTCWECMKGDGTWTIIFRKGGRWCYIDESKRVHMGTWAISNSQKEPITIKEDDEGIGSYTLGFDKDRKHLYWLDFVKIGDKP